MNAPPTRRARTGKLPVVDRRAASRGGSTLQSVKGLITRPLGLERRNGELHVVLVDRRRLPEVAPVRADIMARLRAHAHDNPGQTLDALVAAHRMLGQRGWYSLRSLPASVLAAALGQAEMLRGRESSSALECLIEQLRQSWSDALRHSSRRRAVAPDAVQVVPRGGSASSAQWSDDDANDALAQPEAL